ncbi:helix-turn-helix transcriptional regulator [Sphingobium sp. WCS2017Hpa-17]|uniref:helix-turn-helix domain-containing protein n=1 Tax=Sphingobium sp. WCS2017Hpa-17 TaxID=3073638 RepID=UPI00288C0EB8|nr:helix-turn-helix transcriptional regulator [Sphingobium sp. WCS2017Hpa-17]
MESEVPRILALLKDCYRDKRIRYRDIASQLDVSEPTVKRYLGGRGLTLDMLERLCAVAGLRLSDLHDMLASEQARTNGRLSLRQEYGLTHNLFAAFIFYLLRSGWKVPAIMSEFELTEARMFLLLRVLEKLELIDILPHNRVRLTVGGSPDWLPDGPVRRSFDGSMRAIFESADYHSPATIWELETIKLNRAMLGRLRAMIDGFAREVREMGEVGSRDESAQWYSILCTARPVDPIDILNAGGPRKG